jgi:hypothetical protein
MLWQFEFEFEFSKIWHRKPMDSENLSEALCTVMLFLAGDVSDCVS